MYRVTRDTKYGMPCCEDAARLRPNQDTHVLAERRMLMTRDLEIIRIKKDWSDHPRWKGVQRPYSAEDVYRLRGTLAVEYTLARRGAEKLWQHLKEEPFVNALGALTGNQALQQVKAGLKAIYLSGWQVAADGNLSGDMYPVQ